MDITAKLTDVYHAQARVGLRQDAITWGLMFAQADLSALMTSEQEALRFDLHAFVHHPPRGISAEGEHVTDFFALDLVEAQRILLGIFRFAAARETLPLPPALRQYPPRAVWWEDHYEWIQEDNEGLLTPAEQLQVSVVRLLLRLPHGYVINACQAPRLRQKPPCGRLFLTNKSIQRYCSPTCQQRAHHRRNRRPHPQTAPV